MPLLQTVDSLDAIPEAARGAYVKDEASGKFVLDFEVPDVDGLKKALSAERGLNKAAKDKVAAWERLGVSPEEIETRLEAERVKAEDALKKAGKFDEVLATHLGKAKQERDEAVSKAAKERDSALNVARNSVMKSDLGAALVKAKASAEGMAALPKLIGDRIRIEFDENGLASSTILEADGKTPMVGSGPQGLATYDDLVKEVAQKQYPSLFEGAGGGSGTDSKGQRRDASGKTLTRTEFDALGPIERMEKMKAGFKVID
jgi:hypothetical protein